MSMSEVWWSCIDGLLAEVLAEVLIVLLAVVWQRHGGIINKWMNGQDH